MAAVTAIKDQVLSGRSISAAAKNSRAFKARMIAPPSQIVAAMTLSVDVEV